MIREIVLDTETTGLDPLTGDRVVELACVELLNHLPTGNTYHQYVNPERPMSAEAEAVHGLGDAFLADQPVFADIVDSFLEFVGDARFVIHNAPFDIKFLDHELRLLGREPFGLARAVDTLEMARRRFPGAPASLDALCKRFEVDAAARVKHGALVDCELLAEVYLHLIGGRQPVLGLEVATRRRTAATAAARIVRPPRPHAPTAGELEAHRRFVATLSGTLWPVDPQS
jgi:DNA polymerase III subunit epsilon